MDALTGQVIKGYELRDCIGAGGFGVVYKAYQPAVEREVAIKVILPAYANQPEFIRRFENEARIVARLEHPYIVPLFDFWREPDRAILVMRYYPSSLHDHLRQEDRLALDAVQQLVEQMASALELAHRNGVIHRDIKPENILLDHEGNGYLADFGIASYLDHEKNLPTAPGFTGSLEYTPPELLKSQAPTVQSDVYSLGYVIHRMLSGKPAVTEKSVSSWVNHHLSNPLPPDEHIPADVFAVLQRATAKLPEDRYPSILEFVTSLRAAISGQGDVSVPVLEGAPNPYKGLRAFEESDVDDFFGREALTQHLVEQLAEDVSFKRFLAVVGPSGSGKSSVVKAGMIPALRRDALPGSAQWYFAEMTPTGQPFETLAAVLLSVATSPEPDLLARLRANRAGLKDVLEAILPPEQELLLVIDQFEELFILAQSDAEITAFLDNLYTAVTAASSRLRLVITLRADFYDRPLLYGDFAELMRMRSAVVVPLSAREFEEAIRGPAQRVGVEVEPPLAAAIISDLRGEPGALPLLQYALTELFEQREGNVLTLKAYQACGGVLQTLTRRAEDIYQAMPPDRQTCVRQIFLRMVTLGEGIEDTRRQVLFSELSAVADDRAILDEILGAFGKGRLLTFEHDPATREPSIEIAHEALIREWTQLRKWLEESRNDVRMQRLLATACQEWIDAGRQSGFLLARGRLAQFEEWASTSTVALTPEERSFLQASLAERERQDAVEAERQAYAINLEQRARSRLQILAAVLAVGIVGALLLSALALNEREHARDAQRESERNARLSHDTALLSSSQLSLYRDNNADLAITLALEAHKVGSLPEQEYRALSEAAYAPGTRRVFAGHTGPVYRIDLSQDGTRVLSGSTDRTIRLWDVETGATLRVFPGDDDTTGDIIEGHTERVNDVAFSPDEQLMASASLDQTARLWDIETGETLHVLEGHTRQVMSVAFSPDGRVLATASDTIRLWDVETGELLETFPVDDDETETREGHAAPLTAVLFAPDGESLYSASEDHFALLWDLETITITREFENTNIVFNLALSPDAATLAMATHDRKWILWDIATGEEQLSIQEHTASLYSAVFSPDGNMLLTVSQDQSIRLWDSKRGAEIRRFIGHGDRVFDTAFLPDGKQFITASWDNTLRLWDVQVDGFIQAFEGPEENVYHTVFSPDGSQVIAGGRDHVLWIWDVATGELLHTLGPDDPETPDVIEGHSSDIYAIAVSPDGNYILAAGDSDVVFVWDAHTYELLRVWGPDDPETPDVIEGHLVGGTSIWAIDFSPDGQTACSGGYDKLAVCWDVATGEVVRVFEGHEHGIFDLQFLSDGQRFLTASWDKTVKLWDFQTGEVIRTYDGHTDWVWSVALSPDENTFLSTSTDKTLILWDIETGHEVRRYIGHDDGVLTVFFNHDGSQAVSGGRDGHIILWDVETGELMRQYSNTVDWVWSLDYNPADAVFVSAGYKASVKLWPLQTFDQLLEWTHQNRYVRELTCPERKVYRVEPYCD